MHDAGITFDDIFDDIEGIMGKLQEHKKLSYSGLQQQLGWTPRLHLIKYIHFFESQDWVDYDRVSDELSILDAGEESLVDASRWEPAARATFDEFVARTPADDEHTDPERDAYFDEDGDVTAMISPDEIELLDLTASVELVQEDSYGTESEPAPMRSGSFSDTHDELLVPDAIHTTQAEPERSGRFDAPHEDASPSAPQAPVSPTSQMNDSPSNTTPPPRSSYEEETSMTSDPYSTDSSYSTSATSSAEGLYSRQEEVGSGGVGTVYKGLQTRLGRPVAVKEIRNIFHVFADVQRDDIVRRFVEIVQTQATLDHPNIIQIFDVVYDTDYPYVVMQWAPKGSLRRLIDVEGRPPLNVAMSYFLQILHALNSAHDQNIVHGGLKPENVVLDPAGNAMLTDFGMTQVVERASGSGGNQVYVGVGTVAYLSPEQFHNPNLANVQSDIYSLGIMFYEMLTGKVPGRRSPMPSSFFPDIPRKLDDIFDKMCMDDTEDRYQSVREILREIYTSPEVLDIMDKRSGVLFLRDPIVHGELGMDELQGDGPDSLLEYDAPRQSYTVEGSAPSYSAETSQGAASIEAEAPRAEAPDDEEIPLPEEGLSTASSVAEVADKLDQYSALFDDDDDDDF